MCLRPRPPPAVVSFVTCSFPVVVDFIINCSMRMPAKQNAIKPPPPTPTPPQRASRANDGQRHRQKNAKNAKRRIAENIVSQSQEYTTQATFFELRTKARRNSARYSVVFFEQSENETQPSPTTSATSGRVRNPRAGRCFRSQGETGLKEKNRQQDIKSSKNHPGK